MKEYIWPGNIRELRNVVERASIIFPNKVISAKNIRENLLRVNIPDSTEEKDTLWEMTSSLTEVDQNSELDDENRISVPHPSHYKKWFDFVYEHSKNDYKTKVDFEEWIDGVYGAYKIRAKVGKTKLALLNFWYDALKNHDDDPEFWTDILYFGMKITTKGQFAPYSKIS